MKHKPFTTDGCSGGMSWVWMKLFKTETPWENCCIIHDKAYWRGSSDPVCRKEADLKLRECVRRKGYPIWAGLMYYAVRIGGHPVLPLPWRWGYGLPYRQSCRYRGQPKKD